jgi:3-methyl-2-oxobutanoate hydroxymethyltransferase
MSYQTSIPDAIANSGKLIKAGADAVKLEGGAEMASTISSLVNIGIPVMGHIGLQPQTTMLTQGYRVQGRTKQSAMKLIKDAKALEDAGVFCIVLEMVSHQVAQIITKSVNVPTIGIGSGLDCDGQVLVVQDMLGMYQKINPKFVKRYLNLSDNIINAVKNYKEDIQAKKFPSKDNMFSMDAEEFDKLERELGTQKD